MLKTLLPVNRFPPPQSLDSRPSPGYTRPMITVTISSQSQPLTFPKINTVLQLLQKLDLRVNDALIIRDNELLTPDRRLHDGDHVTVRLVTSRG